MFTIYHIAPCLGADFVSPVYGMSAELVEAPIVRGIWCEWLAPAARGTWWYQVCGSGRWRRAMGNGSSQSQIEAHSPVCSCCLSRRGSISLDHSHRRIAFSPCSPHIISRRDVWVGALVSVQDAMILDIRLLLLLKIKED